MLIMSGRISITKWIRTSAICLSRRWKMSPSLWNACVERMCCDAKVVSYQHWCLFGKYRRSCPEIILPETRKGDRKQSSQNLVGFQQLNRLRHR